MCDKTKLFSYFSSLVIGIVAICFLFMHPDPTFAAIVFGSGTVPFFVGGGRNGTKEFQQDMRNMRNEIREVKEDLKILKSKHFPKSPKAP